MSLLVISEDAKTIEQELKPLYVSPMEMKYEWEKPEHELGVRVAAQQMLDKGMSKVDILVVLGGLLEAFDLDERQYKGY